MTRSLLLTLLLVLVLSCAIAACSDDAAGGSACSVSLDECNAAPGCVVLDCDACNGYAPAPYCQSDDILEEIDPCGAGCVEACSQLGENECVASASSGCQRGTCTDCDGNEVFAGCYETTAPSCPDLACP